jgi:hypothetical protein
MAEIYQTSRQGDRLARIDAVGNTTASPDRVLTLDPFRSH